MLFIGTRFSNLYTAVDTPAEAAWLCKSSRVFSIPTLACVLMHNEMHARAEMAVEETSVPHQNQEQAANQLE